jgi:lysyl-tRNA synthetase class 2
MKKNILIDRALSLVKARNFFKQRNILEVDCPQMGKKASIDLHIDLFKVKSKEGLNYYLHSSPEYFMKRLLAIGLTDIYQLAHVFRDESPSSIHNPEFMMAEWYRSHFSLDQMIEETLDFITLFLQPSMIKRMTYREAFKSYAGIDYVYATCEELIHLLESKGITPYSGILDEGKDSLLNLILGTLIEPFFKKEDIIVLKYFPSSQAALSKKIKIEDEEVGLRFEIYFKGIELANGYMELLDNEEQSLRLHEENLLRKKFGKEELPIDENFLNALKTNIPPCCGVAVGFDRIMMLKNMKNNLHEVIAFGFNEI